MHLVAKDEVYTSWVLLFSEPVLRVNFHEKSAPIWTSTLRCSQFYSSSDDNCIHPAVSKFGPKMLFVRFNAFNDKYFKNRDHDFNTTAATRD